MKIKCTNCDYTETTDKDFFVKLIGGAMPVGGFWAWTTYLFAGTGFAMAIVLAIIGGGVAMLIYKDEIVEWIINNDYKCPNCGQVEWKADTDERKPAIVKKIVNKEQTNAIKDSDESIDEAVKRWLDELKDIDEPYDNREDVQKRITIAEALLRAHDIEFEAVQSGWLILEQSGDLITIKSIDELERYAISR